MDNVTIGIVAVAFTEVTKQIPFIEKYKLSQVVCILWAIAINCFLAWCLTPETLINGFIIGATATGLIKTITYIKKK